MAIVSIGDILDRVAEFEKQLEDYYASVRDEAQDDGARLLTYYLCRHRRHLETATKQMNDVELAHIRKAQLKYDVELSPGTGSHLPEASAQEIKGQELLQTAVEHDTLLIALYNGILEQPLNTEVATFIESLRRTEERDIVMLKKMVAMGYF